MLKDDTACSCVKAAAAGAQVIRGFNTWLYTGSPDVFLFSWTQFQLD